MVKLQPEPFTTTQERLIASFNFSDVAGGAGYQTFNGMDLDGGAKLLTTTTLDSRDGLSHKADTESGWDLDIDLDFDLEFVLPRTINGDVLISPTFYAGNTNGAATADTRLEITIIHVDAASSETIIGTQTQTEEVNHPASAGRTTRRTTVKIPVTRTRFAKGEKLRISIEVWGQAGGSNSFSGIYHDGSNRDFGFDLDVGTSITAPTNLLISVPFEIDL